MLLVYEKNVATFSCCGKNQEYVTYLEYVVHSLSLIKIKNVFSVIVLLIESLRNTTRLLMTSQRSLETSAIFRFAPMLVKAWRDRARF